MARFLAPIALVLSIALTGVASAAPGNALAEASQAGSITPHGVWDGR